MTKPTITTKFYEDSEVKQSAIFAKKDVIRRNANSKNLYTVDEQAVGDVMLMAAQNAFIRSRCFLNYREGSMVIKVESPKASDRVTEAADQFEKAMADLNALRKVKNGHYLFHIFPRK